MRSEQEDLDTVTTDGLSSDIFISKIYTHLCYVALEDVMQYNIYNLP